MLTISYVAANARWGGRHAATLCRWQGALIFFLPPCVCVCSFMAVVDYIWHAVLACVGVRSTWLSTCTCTPSMYRCCHAYASTLILSFDVSSHTNVHQSTHSSPVPPPHVPIPTFPVVAMDRRRLNAIHDVLSILSDPVSALWAQWEVEQGAALGETKENLNGREMRVMNSGRGH